MFRFFPVAMGSGGPPQEVRFHAFGRVAGDRQRRGTNTSGKWVPSHKIKETIYIYIIYILYNHDWFLVVCF
jgi:hypothetical protein